MNKCVEMGEYSYGNITGYHKGDINIHNDVWIGRNVTLLSGITIHNGVVVATGSIVTKDYPPYSIVAGNPEKLPEKDLTMMKLLFY